MHDELKHLKFYRLINPNELTKGQFQKLKFEINHPMPNLISDEYLDFKLWYRGEPSRQKSFASFLIDRLYLLSKHSSKDITKILEVGCGKTAKLSKLLAAEGYEVTCIDSKLELTNCDTIKAIKGNFDYQTFDLTGFDCVIAQEPCAAAEHIVRACINKQIPFIISLCGVPHTLISGEKPDNVYTWYSYLLNISPNNISLELSKVIPLSQSFIISYPKLDKNSIDN